LEAEPYNPASKKTKSRPRLWTNRGRLEARSCQAGLLVANYQLS
jgi:hypothetical protein